MTTPPKSPTLHALVIDDEKNIRSTLTVCLEGMGCDVVAVASSQAALSALGRKHFDFAFLDLRLDKESGLDLIPELLALTPNLDIVIITAYATFDTAVEAIRRGARDYLPKPFSPAQVRHLVEQAIERRALTWRVTNLENRLADEAPEVELFSDSAAVRTILGPSPEWPTRTRPTLSRRRRLPARVFADALHGRARARRPFVTVVPDVVGGLRKRTFRPRQGPSPARCATSSAASSADGGTLFLDETPSSAGCRPSSSLLARKAVRAPRDNQTRSADVRVVAATNRNLEDDVAKRAIRGTSTVSTWSRSSCRRLGEGDICASPIGFWRSLPQNPRGSLSACRPRRSMRFSVTPGPATCASSAT
jgi:NtrC-family two-component system response regulator AlgB